MTAPPDVVLLDLDGTLVDSAPGILGSMRAAFDELGLPWPEGTVDRTLLGPPLHEWLSAIVGDTAARAVIPVYRRHYAENGLLGTTPYPGIDDMLGDLVARGARLALATSKAEAFGRMILEQQSWAELFAAAVGDTLDNARPNKAAVIAEALVQLGTPDGAVMVGDRGPDVAGARANGLDFLGAGWGYALPGELVEAGAVTVYDHVADLRTALS